MGKGMIDQDQVESTTFGNQLARDAQSKAGAVELARRRRPPRLRWLPVRAPRTPSSTNGSSNAPSPLATSSTAVRVDTERLIKSMLSPGPQVTAHRTRESRAMAVHGREVADVDVGRR